MRTLIVVVLVFGVAAAAPRAAGQWLELSTRPDPPVLGNDTFAAALAAELEPEMDRDAAEDPFALAASNVRRLARTLLRSASPDPARASVHIVRGMKLFDRRHEFDEALDRLVTLRARALRAGDDAVSAGRAAELVAEFNDLVDRRLARSEPLTGEDLAALLSPLEDALRLASSSPGGAPSPAFRALVNQASADESIRVVTAEIAEFFERGWAFADLRPRIVRWHERVHEALAYLSAAADATWLSEAQRQDAAERALIALHAFRDPQRRTEGEWLLEALVAEKQLLREATGLAQYRSHRADLTAFATALVLAHQTWGFDAPEVDVDHLIERLNWLSVIAERMNRFRTLSRDETPVDLRRVRVQVAEAYLASERAVVRQLDAMVKHQRSPLADPALAAAVAEHRRLLDDLVRLENVSRWADAMILIRPASAARFHDQLRRLVNHLGDPVRRVDAALALDRIEAEIARYWPMPFEEELRLRSRVADRATDGRYRELLDVLDALRDHWARELAESGPALSRPYAQRLETLHLLMSAMHDVAELLRDDRAAARLNAHDDWWLPPNAPRLAMQRLLPILHRASRAAIEEDDGRLARELLAIDREGALARVVGRRLGSDKPPPIDQVDAAMICRFAAEALHALARERTEEAHDLWRYANRMAAIVLNKM